MKSCSTGSLSFHDACQAKPAVIPAHVVSVQWQPCGATSTAWRSVTAGQTPSRGDVSVVDLQARLVLCPELDGDLFAGHRRPDNDHEQLRDEEHGDEGDDADDPGEQPIVPAE